MMKRRGETSSQKWTGTNDNGITEAEVKSPKEKDKLLRNSLDQQERPRRHKGRAEEFVGSHPSEPASARTVRSPPPLQRRQNPIQRRWSRTRDEQPARVFAEHESRYTARRSNDIVIAEVGKSMDKQTAGTQQRATIDPKLKRQWNDG